VEKKKGEKNHFYNAPEVLLALSSVISCGKLRRLILAYYLAALSGSF